jgi:hypothetical protein
MTAARRACRVLDGGPLRSPPLPQQLWFGPRSPHVVVPRGLHRSQDVLGGVRPLLPQRLEGLDPVAEFLERRRSEVVDASARHGLDSDDAGLAQDLEVLGGLRLADAEGVGDLSDRERPATQQLDDLEPPGFAERGEGGRVHGRTLRPRHTPVKGDVFPERNTERAGNLARP